MPTPVEIEGLIPAPAVQLFQAWTEPALIARWWPHAATVDRCVSEPRPGGEFVLLLRAADQQLYGFEARWIEVVPARRLAFRGTLVGMSGEVEMSIDFGAVEQGTRLRLRHQVSDAGLPPAQMRAAWLAALDRLRALALEWPAAG